MEPIVDIYLYAAARAQSLRKIVAPVLNTGGIVISDRSFISSLAINGYAHGFGIEPVLQINKHAIKGFVPDLVIYLDMPLTYSIKRTSDANGDKFEGMEIKFLRKAIKGYNEVGKHKIFRNKWIKVKATGTKEEVHTRILRKIKPFLAKLGS